jgi:anti-sigma28 factor (negative regulator of flagellin synthesis)
MAKQPTGPAPRREDVPAKEKDLRSAKITAVRVAVQTGSYVIDKDAVAENIVTRELKPIN